MISKFEIHKQVHEKRSTVSFYEVLEKYLQIKKLDKFVFIDGGSGIGAVGNKVKTICDQHNQPCQIHLVEPLPENIHVLNKNYKIKDYFIHDVALSDRSGEATFAVPNRRKSATGKWAKNSSTGGTLVFDKTMTDQITVKTVRLEDIVSDQVNIMKLDLQGGEYDALQGYSNKLKGIDIFYLEHIMGRNLEKLLSVIPDNFELVFDTVMGGVVGKHIPLDLIRADGIELDSVQIGLFDQNAIIRGHFTDERWDISKWDIERKLFNNIKKYRFSWFALDLFLVNSKLKNRIELFNK